MRLNKFVAQHSHYSRRQVDELLQQGKISVNEEVVTELGSKIDPEQASVTVNGKIISTEKQLLYIMLNKPAGYVVTKEDKHAERTVMDLLPRSMREVNPVGRLDKRSEGLLLLTNDGTFIHTYTHPKFEKDKEYIVIVKESISDKALQQLRTGIPLEEGNTGACQVERLARNRFRIILYQGWNRQIRRMVETVNNKVIGLQRIRIGNLTLGTLPLGKWQVLNPKRMQQL